MSAATREAAVTDWHAPDDMMARYVAGTADGSDGGLGPDEVWSLEAHLETCATCRARLATATAAGSPATMTVLEHVRGGLDAALPAVRRTPARRRLSARWMAPTAIPWLATLAVLLLTAAVLAVAARASEPGLSRLLLLLAPLAPLLGVAASWGRGMDPAYELVAGSSRAGLELVLRRTLAVLAVVLPALALVGWATGTTLALWLLPCLAFTGCTLALGDMVGVPRAAAVLGGLWAAGVIVPSVATAHLSALLRPGSLPAWALLTAIAAAVLIARKNSYRRLVGAS